MKNFPPLFLAVAIVVVGVSCERNKPIENPERTLSINLNVVSDIATRATATDAENRVDAFDVFLFDATSGLLEAVQRNVTASAPEAGNVAGESKIGQVTFTVVGEGTKNILAVANGASQVSLPSISVGITTYDQMLDATALLPSSGVPGSPFVMSGYANSVAADGSATLSLRRRVAKITVENLSAQDGLVINTLQIAQTADRSYLFQEGHPEDVTYVDHAAVEASTTNAFYVYPQPAATNQLALTVSGTINGVDFSQSLPVQPASGVDMDSNMQYAVKISIDDAVVQLETTEQVVEEWGNGDDITGEIGLPLNVLTKIPDPAFLEYCLSKMPEWDINGDGLLSIAEAAAVKSINVNGTIDSGTGHYTGEIASLKGIEYFTGLTNLSCSGNQLTALDVSANTKLIYLHCINNQLSSLDVSKNALLVQLSCSNNQLTALDVSANTALSSLTCSNNQLSVLDVSANTALSHLSCDYNQLTTLDVSKNTVLTVLSCNNNQLTALNVSRCTVLKELWCSRNQLTLLDVSECIALKELHCSSNQFTALDVTKNTNLTELRCMYNQLTSLHLPQSTTLTSIECENNIITSLNLSGCTALTTLRCYRNQLIALDVSNNTALTDLDCDFNPGDDRSRFLVKAWFHNNSIPSDFTTSDWTLNGKPVSIFYYMNDSDLDVSAQGTIGSLTWNLSTDGILTISGNGDMPDYTSYDRNIPWYPYRSFIQEVIIADGVTSIGRYAFATYYGGIKSVSIANSIENIYLGAFDKCTGLTNISIPASVTGIGYSNTSAYNVTSVFTSCSNLININVDADNPRFSSEDGVLFNKDKTKIIAYPAGKSDSRYIIPSSVTSIGGNAFYDCKTLTEIVIPNSVTSISGQAFDGCSGLTNISIPISVTYVGSAAFYGCSSLTAINIPDGVTIIESQTFRGCSSLTSIIIPENVTNIGLYGGYTFDECLNLKQVTIMAAIPPTLYSDNSDFPTTDDTLYVPKGSLAAYQNDAAWSAAFSTIVEQEG
jgi:hypothetical protein